MNPRLFLTSLIAVSLIVHLLRFPHLILENGGGAFLILFFAMLNIISLPLLIAERVLDINLAKIDIGSLIQIRKGRPVGFFDRMFIVLWFGLRLTVSLAFLWFFMFLSGTSLLYFFYFLSFVVGSRVNVVDLPSFPDMELSAFGALLWVLASFLCYLKMKDFFLKKSVQWILPFCLTLLLVLFLKIIFLVDDYAGLKILFYPDFSGLNGYSLQNAIGHSVACLFIGFGFYNHLVFANRGGDPIELFIRTMIQTLCLGVLIGVMALPMIEQVREMPFGSYWIFEILPRWLSYGEYGNYYCSLFFLAITCLGFHITVVLLDIMSRNLGQLYRLSDKPRTATLFYGVFIAICTAVLLYLQRNLQGWGGQSLLLSIDYIVVDVLMPLYVLMILWVVFRYTSSSERLEVFAEQQVFFHNRIFYQVWEKTALYLVPFLILLSWLLSFRS